MNDKHHTAAEANFGEHDYVKPSYDDIKTPVVIFVGIISAIITYLIVVVVQGLTYEMQMEMIRKRSYDVQYGQSVRAIEEQKAGLQADPAKGRLSIDEAMKETLAKYSTHSSQ